LQLPLNVQPKFFPVAADPSARLIIAADLQNGPQAALRLSGAVFAAVWVQERDIASATTLAELLEECGLPPELLAHSQSATVQDQYDANTRAAIEAGLFGAPSYCVDGEIFWGQDRLEFLERKLKTL
jgi:carboxymethylenebutenolidase